MCHITAVSRKTPDAGGVFCWKTVLIMPEKNGEAACGFV